MIWYSVGEQPEVEAGRHHAYLFEFVADDRVEVSEHRVLPMALSEVDEIAGSAERVGGREGNSLERTRLGLRVGAFERGQCIGIGEREAFGDASPHRLAAVAIGVHVASHPDDLTGVDGHGAGSRRRWN